MKSAGIDEMALIIAHGHGIRAMSAIWSGSTEGEHICARPQPGRLARQTAQGPIRSGCVPVW
ncbi:hypothetical protein [Streptosporangium sp. 'caverna']|uniref:hypothetical protein n=1 Tax=Streptosporangium sp. 'caverna' TaxID=2202249 RepID=UPI000D7DA1E0|nr:hypothetical protein [Streptosporangium sp. 'caverna']AWS42531.1 hypothetical protein DKM19_15370 [Streptosporangium sp. 'caverna']